MIPNASNTCIQCLSSKANITEGIATQNVLYSCNQCGRWQGPPWLKCEPESQELLALCLKKIKGLQKVKVVNASFVWTEPHSKRLKVKITIQKEIESKTILETSQIIEFVLKNQQCDDCKKQWTPHKWDTTVQLRQKVDHKRTLLYIEQLILKHKMYKKCVNIKEVTDGIDFMFANKMAGMEFVMFIASQIVCKHKSAKQLISADKSSNIYNYEYTYHIELAPICREDMIWITPKLQKDLGGSSPICLVIRVGSLIQLFDPMLIRIHTIDSACYWNFEPQTVCTNKSLTEYVIINIDPIKSAQDKTNDYEYCDLELQKITDFGENDTRIFAKSHLGKILNIDDHVLGYDLLSITSGKIDWLQGYGKIDIPDAVIVKKIYPKDTSPKKRDWKLKHLHKEEPTTGKKPAKRQIEKDEKDYEDFLVEIENDPELRSKVKLYKTQESKRKQRQELHNAEKLAKEAEENKNKPKGEEKTEKEEEKEKNNVVSESESDEEYESKQEGSAPEPIPEKPKVEPAAKPAKQMPPQSKRAKKRQEKRRTKRERKESQEEEEKRIIEENKKEEKKEENEEEKNSDEQEEAEFPKMKFSGFKDLKESESDEDKKQ